MAGFDEYHKIDTLYRRDPKGNIILGEYTRPEFEFLSGLDWEWTEKVDGTNIRLYYPGPDDATFRGNEHAYVRGRTDNAQIPPKLLNVLIELMRSMPFEKFFTAEATLYGEGYGAGIQKGGGSYSATPDFVLFDVKVGDWWLRREDVDTVAQELGIASVPIVGSGPISAAEELVRGGFASERWEGVKAEGLVVRPKVELFDRGGRRVITKIKTRDFR